MQGVFLGTFLIGLREGLEATLIVSIVAAFLKRNGHSLRPMFIGVALAVAISLGVGVGLDLLDVYVRTVDLSGLPGGGPPSR